MRENIELICDIAERILGAEQGADRGVLLAGVAQSIAEHMQAEVCSIYIYDERDQELVLRATCGLDLAAVGSVRLGLDEGITGQAVRELRPICVDRASMESSYKYFPGIQEERFEAFLAVPILRGVRRIGALVVQTDSAHAFEDSDITALRAIAAQLAAMFESVKLLNEAREGGVQLEPRGVEMEHGILRGRSASKGVAVGTVCLLDDAGLREETESDEPVDVSEQRAVFEEALQRTVDQIKSLQLSTSTQLEDVAVLIFSAHQLILEDEQFSGRIRELIRQGMRAQGAVTGVVDEYVKVFSKSQVPMIREKVLDVKDLGSRLIRNLQPGEGVEGDYQGKVIAVQELLPSDILKFSAEKVEGLIICSGVTSHNAIICRSLKIPMVAVARDAFTTIQEGAPLLMDAGQGIVYFHPSEEILAQYRELEKTWNALHSTTDVSEDRRTACGARVEVMANVNLLSDLEPAREFKANGVGLYRSEFPFVVRNDFPTEEEQTSIYTRLVDQMEGRPVTLRTLDIGGDKMLSYYSNVNEANPFLGMRAIRFSLQNRDIFSQQLRAFLRAGAGADARIMFPLIASVDDFLSAREIVYDCMEQLDQQGVCFNRDTQLGVMVELPSAVEVVEELAEEADFLSIGSNDLIQYMLAVDRTNEQVSDLYKGHHPAILRAVNRVVRAANTRKKSVSICGDLAAEERMIPFLLGIGLRSFSIDIVNAPAVQRVIEQVALGDAEQEASDLLAMGRISEIEDFLNTT
jgi:phosphotransferase system enzyme I (PtsP)